MQSNRILSLTFVLALAAFDKACAQSVAYAIGRSGALRKTIDGGETCVSLNSGTSLDLFGMSFLDADNGWVVGRSGTIRKTTDGGETWTRQSSGTSLELDSVRFVDANTGWVNAWDSNRMFHTLDGGETWSSQQLGPIQPTAVEAVSMPSALPLDGDYNANGIVEQADLDLVLLNWGEELFNPIASGWINDLPSGSIDQAELDGVLLNWGDTSTAANITAPVPEPGGMVLGLLALTAVRKSSRRSAHRR